MYSSLSLSGATLSSNTLITSSVSAGIYLPQLNYSASSGHRLYIEDDFEHGYLEDLSGYGKFIHPVGLVGSFHETASSQKCTGRVIQFSGTTSSPAYAQVDYYDGINKTSDFTLRCIANNHNVSSKSDIFVRRSGSATQYEWYVYNGKMWFSWRDFSNSQSIIEGPTVSAHTPQALAVSVNPSYIAMAVDGTTTTYSTAAGYVKATSNPIYVGGDPVVNGNYFQGNLSKIQYQNFSYQDFSGWTLVNKYSTASPYADITIVDVDEISDSGFQPYLIEVTAASTNDCSFGYLLATNSDNTWYYPNETGVWTASPDGISKYVTLDRLNRALELLTASYSDFKIRVFFNSLGLDGGGITGGTVYYVDDAAPTEIGHSGTVTYGVNNSLFSRFYDKRMATDSTRVMQVAVQAPGDEVYEPSVTYSWGDGLRGLRSRSFPIDSYWVDPLDLITTSQNHSLPVNLYIGDASYTASQALSVVGNQIAISVKDSLGNWEAPEVSVYKEQGIRPRWNVIDSYSSTSDGMVYVMLPRGSYYFEVTGDNGGSFKFAETVNADGTISLQETGATTPDIVGSSVTQITSTLDDVVIGTGDTPTLTFQIKDKNTKLAKSLTGYRAYFSLRKAYVTSSVVSSRLCTVTSPTKGIAAVQLTSTDTATAGRYIGELHISSSDEVLTSYPRFQIEITDTIR